MWELTFNVQFNPVGEVLGGHFLGADEAEVCTLVLGFDVLYDETPLVAPLVEVHRDAAVTDECKQGNGQGGVRTLFMPRNLKQCQERNLIEFCSLFV